jgi:hypothetical protein
MCFVAFGLPAVALTMVCCCSCEASVERDRYRPFVTILNEVLLCFRTRVRGKEVEDGDIIFAINDPIVVESRHLSTSTKRKPDLICLLAKRFRLLHEDCEDYHFDACVAMASKQNPKKSNIREVAKTTWIDILHSWELEAKGKIALKKRADFKVKDFLGVGKGKMLPLSDELPVASTSQGKCTLYDIS